MPHLAKRSTQKDIKPRRKLVTLTLATKQTLILAHHPERVPSKNKNANPIGITVQPILAPAHRRTEEEEDRDKERWRSNRRMEIARRFVTGSSSKRRARNAAVGGYRQATGIQIVMARCIRALGR